MQTTLINFCVACVMGGAGLFAGVGGAEIFQGIIDEPKPYGLQLVSLEYENGEFKQLVAPINAPVVEAKWAAQIVRNGRPLCGGGGVAPYNGEPKVMTPSAWTGDDCPPLISGDKATGSWTYENVDSRNIVLSGEVIIP